MQNMVRDAVFETKTDGPALAAVSAHIRPGSGMDPAEHVRIYRRAILSTLVRALGNVYPVCKRLVGDQFFDAMARIYCRQIPSRSADLADYGNDFAGFIAGFEPAGEIPYLPDVARLEWHWHRAFHAADETGMDTSGLAGIAEADMSRIVFRLPVSASLIASAYPIGRIWQVNQKDWDSGQTVDLAQGPVRLIVWRRQYDMRVDEIDEAAWPLLTAIADETPFGKLGQSIAADLDILLPRCVQSGWIAGFALR